MVDVIDKERQALNPALKSLLDESANPGNNLVFCSHCSHVLASSKDSTTVQGSHEHFCTNPHGIDFHVSCYKQALGCAISGQPTGADSWFTGYTWRFATCASCSTHLGWLFEITDSHFYGLITQHIQVEDDS